MNDQAREQVATARLVLESLGFDAERSNERSALVLLSLLRLQPNDPWSQAVAPMLGTRAIMDWIRDAFGVSYAANTRETIRRFTLHQFADAMLIEQNPDDPKRPINSPKWCYRIHPRALEVIRSYGGTSYTRLREAYLNDIPGLRSQNEAARAMN